VRWLIDNQLPVALARWLQARGEDAVHVLDRSQGQTGDRDIWETAIAENRIVISKDGDFFILATRPGDFGRLLWLRVGNCRKQTLLAAMDQAWPAIEGAFLSGQTIVEVR
jgi:predicted nuclease of predicted toxin-antitoxin system